MSRPKKPGFDSFELPVDYFNNPQIVEMSKRLGPASLIVVISIYAESVKHFGYYLPASDIALGMISGDAYTTLEFVREVVGEAVRYGIFDAEKYREHNILTSKEIQTAYVSKSKSARRSAAIEPEYSLLDDEKKSGDVTDLSRRIVSEWNRLHDSIPEKRVPETASNDPLFLESLQSLLEGFAGADTMEPWYKVLRNAFNGHAELSLGRIVCHEPTFRMLYEQHPAPCPNPFSDEGIREALDAPDEDEGDEAEITEKTPAEDTRFQIISANPGSQENPNVISVYVANEAPAPSPRKSFANFFAGFPSAAADEEPVREEPAPTEVKAEVQAPAAEPKPDDPELSALLRKILRLYNEKYREAGYADEYQADEALADDMNAVDLLRTYIGEDARCRNPEFWALIIDGLVHLHGFRPSTRPEHPYCLFDPDPSAPYFIPLEGRKKLLYYYRLYVTDPERSPDPRARETGPGFMEMKRREGIDPALLMKEAAKENEPEEPPYPEGITEDQKSLIDALRSNPEIPKGDLGWLEDRIIHPELYKAPDKPYGDRTAPMPWAKKNPPSYEEIVADPKFCHDLAHGSSIRMR